MGEIADYHVNMFASGRWGMPIPKQREYAKTSKETIKNQRFNIVKVISEIHSNRFYGTVLVVTEQNEDFYWVWASNKVTGIAKKACETLEENLDVQSALEIRKTKYGIKIKDKKNAKPCHS